jgi:hypothetical protein
VLKHVLRLRIAISAVLAAFATMAGVTTMRDFHHVDPLGVFVGAALIYTAFAILADERADFGREE